MRFLTLQGADGTTSFDADHQKSSGEIIVFCAVPGSCAGRLHPAWAAEIAWLKLHLESKPYEVKHNNGEWDARVKKIDEATAGYKKPEALVAPRGDLWKAEKAWLDANRAWKKAESEYHLKHWQERITKLEGLMAK